MKKIAVAATLAFAGLFTAFQASAASPQTDTFDVNINLTTGCIISQAPGAVSFTYTAFAGSAQPLDSNGAFKVKCTKNLNFTLALDGGGSYTDDATNLAYTLSLSAGSGTGTGADQPYSITGSMAPGQAGQCAATGASCDNTAATNKTRTLTLSY